MLPGIQGTRQQCLCSEHVGFCKGAAHAAAHVGKASYFGIVSGVDAARSKVRGLESSINR